MATKESKLTVPVELSVSTDSYNKIAAAKQKEGSNVALAISILCAQFLDSYANGGILVKPDSVKSIEKIIGKEVRNDKDVVDAIQKIGGMEDGQHTIKTQVDPSMWPAIQEFATAVGMTPEQVLDDIAHRIIRDSLSFYVSGQSWEPVIYLTEAQGKKLQKMLGKRKFTGQDIMDMVAPEQKELV